MKPKPRLYNYLAIQGGWTCKGCGVVFFGQTQELEDSYYKRHLKIKL